MKKSIGYFSAVILLLAVALFSFSSPQEQFTESFEALTVGSTSFMAGTPLLAFRSNAEVPAPAMSNAFNTIELLSPRAADSDRNSDNFVTPPVIDVWYGDTQEFGNNGVPQAWCNIMGNITDDGTINSFTYTLNGGSPVNLSIGPDNRRLVNSGDFNIDLAVTDLLPGANTVLISATDNDTDTSTKTVTINYTDGTIWPIPYNVDWSMLNNDITKVNEVAHVVDGKFFLPAGGGIRTADPGYDRLIAMGDMTSTNYEVLVPVTIHTMPSDGGVGVLLRWKGHTDTPVTCVQPKCGYLPLGAISWFRASRLEFYQGNNVSFTPTLDVTYMLRTSVETDAATGNTDYRIKFWEQGTTEPIAWNLEQTNGSGDEQEGSLMLISHKADVTFGNVTVTPGSLSISNVQTQLSNNNTEATITWNTNQPTTSRVDYGATVAYGSFEEDMNLVTLHSITLTGLTPESIYQYKISGENSGMEAVEKTGLILSTFTSGIKSDDFCANTLDPVWTFDNPLNDCSFALTGSGTNDSFLEISVPVGEHQIYTSGINAPNLMQSINNSDFEVEVKFESEVVAPQYQQQGILVKESNNRFLRFEFFSKDPNDTFLYAQAFDLPTAQTAFVNTSITTAGIAPLYMRVKRIGNQWTLSYSFDGTNFMVGTTFFNDMVPTQIGPYAGNATGSSSPAHIAKIDYFENLADPIISEDGCTAQQPPVLASIGNQSVEEGNSLPLTLTATDADGDDNLIVFTETGLPGFAQLTDNNDGTASLSIDPLLGDAGTYTMTITVTDSDNLTDDEEFDIVVTEPGTGLMNIVSDDFCDSVLNPVWTFSDPLGDGSYTLTGSGTDDALLEIAVPIGAHQLWIDGIQAPHIIQTSNDTDFELEVKMESAVNSPQYQQQGIIVKQDDYHFLRFEIYSDNSNTKALSAILESATNSFPLDGIIPVNIPIGPLDTAPTYMRVKREGNQWTQSYSFDDITWTVTGTFSYSLVVSGVGLYAGNAIGTSAPAHTAKIDYFQSLNDPIASEDGCIQQPPVLASIGNQSVEEGNSLPLTLTATDADGNDADIVFTETGLPGFAQLTDNNNGTASLSIDPLLGDAGTYTLTITVTDSDNLTDDEEFDIVVTEANAGVSNLVSDDFCDSVLNPVWTFNDPLADGGSYALTGSYTDDALLEIAVPGGDTHELWVDGIQAPHIIQTSNDTDFELEIKMESAVSAPQFQEQGILIRQDDYHFLRFEFYSRSSGTFIIAAILESATNSFPLDNIIPVNINIGPLDTAPMYMKVKREGDQWTQSYSFDGQNWTATDAFTYAMVVSGVGLYAGNADENSAHTAKIDYFKNLADPIINEDGCVLFLCPTTGAVAASETDVCPNDPFNVTATGLSDMDMAANMEQDFGMEFVAFTSTPTDPYVGGASLGTVVFGSLTEVGTTAVFTGATLGTAGSYEIYAILSPEPTEPTCRPSAMTTITVNALPTVTFTALADLYIDAGEQTGLGGGTPTGGVYSGLGVTDDGNGMTYSFDPAVAGVGTHTITYDVTDGNGCSGSASDDVEVFIPISLNAKVYIQGAALNPNTGEETLMRDDLRVANLLPTTSPYADGLLCDISVFSATGGNAIVDWVWVELRDSTDRAVVVEGRSALLQRDGNIVDIDGTSAVNFNAAADNYYLLIQHRNHLSILSAIPVAMSSSTTIVDLSSDPLDVFGGSNAVADMGSGIYALYAGDFDADGQILNTDVTGVLPFSGTSGYSNSDVNMDGQTLNTDIQLVIRPNSGRGIQY